MLFEKFQEFIGLDLPSAYDPLVYVIISIVAIYLLSEFYKLLRMIVGR